MKVVNPHALNPGAQETGVRKGDGDGTVPLVSLGLMCRKGWKDTKLNPGGIEIVTHELKHDAVPMYVDPRCALQSSQGLLAPPYVRLSI